MKKKFQKTFYHITNNLYIFGFLVVAVLLVQAHYNAKVTEKTLKDSVHQQEILRNIMWVNLLSQRATVLVLSRMVNDDPMTYTRAQNLVQSIPSIIQASDAPTEHEKNLIDQITVLSDLFKNLPNVFRPLNPFPYPEVQSHFLQKIEEIGSAFNAEESKEWYKLLDKNASLLKEQKEHQKFFYFMNILFIFYLVFLGWITKRKKQAELDARSAEEANRMKSVFLANISHELRTPMHGILSFASFGIDKIDKVPKEKILTYFTEIRDSGSRLMSLLNDLLDLTKLEAGKIDYNFRAEDLVGLVETVCSEMRAFAEKKGITLEVVTSEKNIMGIFDQEKIIQVLRNLISNAIKFSDNDTQIQIIMHQTNTEIECSVENKGIGIPQLELETVFDKFVQSSKTKTGAGGTGLGLAICKEIIIQHKGKIWVESELNGITRFIFKLPRAATKTI